MALYVIAVWLAAFLILTLLFGFSRINTRIAVWIMIMVLFTFTLGYFTTSRYIPRRPQHPGFLIGEYTLLDSGK